EFGSVTGRRRRCGWFDSVALRRSVVNSSVSGLCITKLDVLDGLDTLRICTGYRINGKVTPEPPLSVEGYADVEPVYEELPGWRGPPGEIPSRPARPANARRYLERLALLVNIPIDMISTGPDREQTIVLQHPFGA